MYFETGEVYNGFWENNMMNGKASLKRKDGSVFYGVFEQGEPAKIGTIVYSPEHKYEGELDGFLPHGFGKMTFPDAGTYEGDFTSGKMNGLGTMKMANG